MSAETREGRPRGRFAAIPEILARTDRLKPAAFRLYAYYVSVGTIQGCFKAMSTIEAETGVSRSTLFEARQELQDAGLITLTRSVGKPTRVELVDIWPENEAATAPLRVSRATRPDSGHVDEATRPDTGRGVSEIRTPTRPDSGHKEDTSEEDPRRRARRDCYRRLDALGLSVPAAYEWVDELFDADYTRLDVLWIIQEAADRNARSLAYLRAVAQANPPGVHERHQAATRARFQAPARGDTHEGMPKL